MTLNFVCLGGNKCGTTWFYEMLNQHPEINSSKVKEPHYYTTNSDKPLEWYVGGWDLDSDGLTGDFSTTYLYSTEGQINMKKEHNDLKAFIVLRNPVDRAVSHCRHLLRSAPNIEIKKFIKEESEIIENSLYFPRLQKAFEIFGKENVKVLMYDEIKYDPKSFLRKAFNFLEIDPEFIPNDFDKVIGKGYDSKNKSLEKFRIFVQRTLKSLGLGTIINLIKGSGATKIGKGGADNTLVQSIKQNMETYSEGFLKDLDAILEKNLLPECKNTLKFWKKAISSSKEVEI